MIGNDVVDLEIAQKESNWQRKGFLDKIFTQKEQFIIEIASNSTTMVWNLWSRKEAAYKIFNRATGIRSYNPIQFECFDVYEAIGKVIFMENIYFTKTEIKGDCITTVSVENRLDFENIIAFNSLKSIKINGIPNYYDSAQNVLKPVSISHHGKYKQIVTID